VSLRPRPRIPLWRWTVWWVATAFALVLFYVLATPIWLTARAAAGIAEHRARRRRRA
jgi:hypothetical protein